MSDLRSFDTLANEGTYFSWTTMNFVKVGGLTNFPKFWKQAEKYIVNHSFILFTTQDII